MCPKSDPNLEAAYALQTPEDSRRLYAEWAQSYDDDFALASDYVLPQEVAQHFASAGGIGPVLDIGAGTGLCGQALQALQITPIDATDISSEMLNIARQKSFYRRLFLGDLTKQLDVADNTYAGIVSSGTFTNGHVGPDAFDEVLRITRPDGLLAISINAQHFGSAGFEAKFAALTPRITDLQLHKIRFYGPKATSAHKDDTGFVALFRKRNS